MDRHGRPPTPGLLEKLADALGHRGPDGRRWTVSGGLGLVHTRLAIVDLETGDQPLFANLDLASAPVERGQDAIRSGGNGQVPTYESWLALIANGEIYNDPLVRSQVGEHRFVTRSDCETPLILYEDHGLGFADHLRGMYALAIHDPRPGAEPIRTGNDTGRLVLSRDPFGIKPLYYLETDEGFAFASEPQALFKAGLASPVLRRPARDELLQLQFTTGRASIFAGVSRVLPGETIVVERGRISEMRTRPALPDGAPLVLDEEKALERLDAILMDSVTVHSRADVPYGLFLSGGIDSAAILAAMARLSQDPVVAFTAGFPDGPVHDERADARAMASAVGAEHVEVEFRAEDFWTLLPKVANCLDDPVADYATLPAFRLANVARQADIKVVLTGEGGDELFGGYGRYRRCVRSPLLGGRPMRHRGVFDGLDVLVDGSGWRDGIARSESAAAQSSRTRLQVAQAVDVADWLPNDLLSKLDRCLMAQGVEGRVPFLDPSVASFVFLLPDRLKISGGLGKSLLRRWLADALPASRPFAAKKGFTVPVAYWMASRASDLGRLVARQPGVAAACHPGRVEALFASVTSRPRVDQAAWILLFYALWHQCHIVGHSPDGDVFETLSA